MIHQLKAIKGSERVSLILSFKPGHMHLPYQWENEIQRSLDNGPITIVHRFDPQFPYVMRGPAKDVLHELTEYLKTAEMEMFKNAFPFDKIFMIQRDDR